MIYKNYFLPLFIGTLMICVSACDSKDDNNPPEPTAVEKAFAQKYPDATQVSWSTHGSYLEVDFVYEQHEREAWFQNNGKWIFTKTEVPKTEVSELILLAFEASMYESWLIDGYYLLERNSLPDEYIIEVEQDNEDVSLYYKADGTLIRTVSDIENSSDNLPNAISAAIKAQYPNGVIIDINQTATKGYDITILNNGQIKEVIFSNDQWVETRCQIAVTALPAAVTNALKDSAYDGYSIDYVYAMTNAAKTDYYLIEMKKSGSVDLTVRLLPSGDPLPN